VLELWQRLHSDRRKYLFPTVNPVVLQQTLNRVRPAHSFCPFGLHIQFIDNSSDISHIWGHLYDRILPTEARAELRAFGCGPKYDRAPGRSFEQAAWHDLFACNFLSF